MYECKSGFDNEEDIFKSEPSKMMDAFPWRALLLSLSRLLVCLVSFVNGSSRLVLRADGSLTTKHIVKNKYKYLKYSHSSNTVSVLSLSLLSDPILCCVAALSAFSLLVAIALSYARTSKSQNCSKEERNKTFLDFFIFTLITLELIFSATDMINNIPEAMNHAHLLINYVSIYEGLSFLMTASTVSGFQIFFWFGGLDFLNNSLLHQKIKIEE